MLELQVGLKMNLQKTKILSPDAPQLSVENHTLEVVEYYVYLGHNVKQSKETRPLK